MTAPYAPPEAPVAHESALPARPRPVLVLPAVLLAFGLHAGLDHLLTELGIPRSYDGRALRVVIFSALAALQTFLGIALPTRVVKLQLDAPAALAGATTLALVVVMPSLVTSSMLIGVIQSLPVIVALVWGILQSR